MGIGEGGAAMAAFTAVAEPARPRIGADRFRALTDRLKKPAAALPVLDIQAAPPAPAFETIDIAPPIPVIAQVAEPVLAQSPAVETVEPVDLVIPPFEVPTFEVPAFTVPEPVLLEPQIAAAPEPVAASEPVILAAPAIAPFVAPEPTLAVPAQPVLSPLQRVLAAQHKSTAAPVLPEILPPPPPPPPPLVFEENGERFTVEAPTMEVVQERLRGDATVRLQQLDIENIWRQVLASPTLEERADYLREAAEIAAAENGGVVPALAMPAEYDLSRIESATGGTLEVAPATVAKSDFQSEEQVDTAELARSLLDMMASGSNSGLPHERALAADTLLRLLPKLAAKPLAMLAQRLAMMDNPPQLLVAKLIRDERVEVSGPLLEDCMHITDQDLTTVVAENHPGKRRMLARRRKLSRAISDLLIATDDSSVLLTLVRNANAEISHDGFVALTLAATRHPDIMAPLSTRADLAAPHAFELFWAAPAQLRRYLLHRFLTDSETLTKILKITLSTQDGDDSKEQNLPSPGEVMELLDLACKGRIETAAERLGEALGVDGATVHRILLDREGEPLVVLLKTAGYPRGSVNDLLPALKRGDIALIAPDRDVTELQTLFDTLSINKARILLTYWNWAVLKSGPYAPVH